jgi:dTDP-4-amino-4,6-dideoxygalactose transaminase
MIAPVHDPNHSYYVWIVRADAEHRDRYVQELNALGVPVKAGYVEPLYRLPAFSHFRHDCPVVEQVQQELITLEMYAWDLNEDNIAQIAEAFHGVCRNGAVRSIA